MKKIFVIKEGDSVKAFASEVKAESEFLKLSFDYLSSYLKDERDFDEFHWDSEKSFTVVVYDSYTDVRINVCWEEVEIIE